MPRFPASAKSYPIALRLLALALLVALAAEVPYVIADSQASRGWAFAGMIWCPHDYANFGAAMNEGGSSSSWLIHNHTTGEPHGAILMYPLYVALGKLAAALGFSVDVVFRLAALLGRVALLLSLWRLSRAALRGTGNATLGFILAAFSAGMGVLIALPQAIGLLPSGSEPYLPTVGTYPELGTFLVLLTTPHLLFGLVLTLELARLYLRSWDEDSPPAGALFAAASVLALLLGLVNTFGVPAVLPPLAVHLCLATLMQRRVPRRPAAVLIGAVVFGLPVPLYSLVVMRQDSIWTTTHVVQNLLPSPDLAHLLTGLCVPALLALLGLPRLLRQPRPRSLVLPVWCLTCLVLMYLPLTYQRRFGYGLQPLLAMVAAVGLGPILARVAAVDGWATRLRRWAVLILVLPLLFTGSITLCISSVRIAATPQDHQLYFQPMAVADAARWLASQLEDDEVVLAQRETGNYLVRFGRGRAYVAHHITTVDYEAKVELSKQFLSGSMAAEAQEPFLRDNGITYVLVGPTELELGAAWLADAPYLEPVYESEGVTIYRVRGQQSVARWKPYRMSHRSTGGTRTNML